MIDHARSAEAATGHKLRVFMDLAGPNPQVRRPQRLHAQQQQGQVVFLGEADGAVGL